MDEETGTSPKAIFFDHRGEETIAWIIRWAKKKAISYYRRGEDALAWSVRWTKKQEPVLKPFPVTIGVKKP
jgi:hypothetical protein